MKKIYKCLPLFILLIGEVFGQQLPVDNQYQINKFSLSPAYAGYNKNVEAFIGTRRNWVGIEGAPEKQMVNINGPLADNAGVGALFTHEKTGNFSHFYGSAAYAYHMEMSDEQYLSFGLSAELYRNQIEGASVKSQGVDPVIMLNQVVNGTAFNASFGAALRLKGLNFGIVIPRILESKIKYVENSQYTMARTYVAHFSYLIDNDNDFIFEPFAVGRMTNNSGILFELGMMARYKKRIWSTIHYRSGGFGLNIGAALHERIIMNYSYEVGGNGMLGLSSGTHELSLGFLIKRARREGPSMFPESEETKVTNEMKKKLKEVQEVQNELSKSIVENNQKIQELEKRIDSLQKQQPQTPPKPEEEEYSKPLILKNIKFGNNSDRLFSSSFPALNRLAIEMRKNPSLQILITGHTDNVGSSRYNKRLSEKRAIAVKKYLVERQRIDENRIKTMGMGEEKPVADNSTPQGQAANRRIEVRFKKK